MASPKPGTPLPSPRKPSPRKPSPAARSLRLTAAVYLLLAGCSGPGGASDQNSTGPADLPPENAATPGVQHLGGTSAVEGETQSVGSGTPAPNPRREPEIQEYPVPAGSRPHDVAPAPDGPVWYTAQSAGALGRLDPATGDTHHVPLGAGSSPHGVIVGPDGAAWVTDSWLNAVVRVDPLTEQ